jgi:integrase
VKLTDSEVKRAKASDKPWKISDGHGLFLLVQPTGGRLWRFAYRFDGRQKLLALGSYPSTTLAMAREKHMEARRLLAQVIDPSEAKKAKKAAGITFRTVAEEWYAAWHANKSQRYREYVRRRFRDDIYPSLGNKPIAQITTPMIVAIGKKIEQRGAFEIARRAIGSVGQVMRYGAGHGYCERDVTQDFKSSDVLKASAKGHHARVDDAELPGVVAALYRHPGLITRMACKLTMYTALRTSNVIGLEWAWVNLEDARIDFPSDVMKIRVPFICPLSDRAVAVLAACKQFSEGERFVFPGQKHGAALSNGAMLKALRDAGYGGRHTMHSFRAVFTTWAAEAGFSKDHVEAQLHHIRKGVRSHYDFASYIPQRRELMNAWAAHLDALASQGVALAAD